MDARVNLLGDEGYADITEREEIASNVGAAEVIELSCSIVRDMIHRPEHALECLYTFGHETDSR